MDNTIRNIIASTLKEKSINEQEFANKLRVEESTIVAYELGVKYPTIDGLKQMCFILDKTPDELYTGTNKKPLSLEGLTNEQKAVVRNLRMIMRKK